MHTLYGYDGSGSAAIEAALVLAGIDYEVVKAASWDPHSDVEALTRVNPMRQIPTLVTPEGLVLTESAAILLHLGLAHPASGLLPQDTAGRARSLRALVFIAANCYGAISVGDFPERWTTDASEPARASVKAAARERLHAHWTIFADLHPERPFLSGDHPGAADLLAAVVSRWTGTRAHLAESRPDFHALLVRTDTHPSVAAVFQRHWPGTAR